MMKIKKTTLKIAGLTLFFSLLAIAPAESTKRYAYEKDPSFCIEKRMDRRPTKPKRDYDCRQGNEGECKGQAKKGRKEKERKERCNQVQARTTPEPSMIIGMLVLAGLTGLVHKKKTR